AVLSLQYFIRTLASSCKGPSPQNEGAKVTAKIHQPTIPSKHFANFFFKPFSKELFQRTEPNVHPLKAGAKINQLFVTSKYFYHFFLNKSSTLIS
ncbi:MAG: hypothetical protein NC410_04690, partial [Oscillibacter sp.]|nr:hypothetical protein [Oscillibacter sp.]